ncbi:tetratricopeptide repeat protein [Lactococcus nasutitermitis]|uniref:Tetratricopeptide repeat protein n=1 Tax=Lactococcus nasutitermitis TaxID=1652957 RepID=A0ABV9JDM3_9LACT|nr:tetratricopeptide repeat protein [Lactococcus nasutitermitis]
MSYSEDTIDFLHKGDLVGMHNSLAKALKNDSSELLADLAEYLQMMGFIDESHQVYDKILADNPATTDYLINLAEIAEDDGDLDQALDYLYQIPASDENYVAALVKIADLYQFDGDFDTAISKLEEARALSDSPLVTFALAESYFEQGDYAKAINDYAKLSERKILHDTKISIYQRIGESYAQLGNFENAISFLEKSYEFDKNPETLYKTALLYGEIHNETRALSIYKRLDGLDIDFLSYELPYAQTLEVDNQFDKALEIAQKGLVKTPNSVPLLHFLSKISYKLKQKEEAERYLMQALDFPELHDETVFLLANLYFAEEDYEAVLNLVPMLEDEHLLAKWLFAQANAALENDAEALALYDELANSSLIENPEFLSDMIHYLLEIGQQEKAQSFIYHYLELEPDDENMRSLLDE